MQENDRLLWLLDWKTRWQAFLYFSNFLWLQTLQDVYEKELNADSYDYITGRIKIFNNIKVYKCKVLARMKVRWPWSFEIAWYWHFIEAYQETSQQKSPSQRVWKPHPSSFIFVKSYNVINFLFVWHYMNDYVDVERSLKLGQFYMKSKILT